MPTLNIGGQRVTVDEDFLDKTPEQQNRIVKGIMASPEFQQATASQPQKVGVGMDVATQLAQGLSKGSYEFLHLPTTLTNLALMGAEKLGIPGADYRFKRPLEALGVEEQVILDTPAQTKLGEVAGTIGEYVGGDIPAAITGVGLGARALQRAASPATRATTTAGRVLEDVGRGAAAKPIATLGGETIASVGAGTGATIAREVAPESAAAELIGATLGGFTPTAAQYLPSAVATRLAKRGIQRLAPKAQQRAARQDAARMLRQGLDEDLLAQRVRETQQLQRDIPGYEPTLGEITESPEIIATQKYVERGLTGPERKRVETLRASNEEAIARAAQESSPKTNLTLDDAFTVAGDNIQRRHGALQTLDEAEAENLTRVTQGLRSGNRASDLGAEIRSELINERNAVKEQMSVFANELGLNNTTQKYNFDAIRQSLIDSVEPRSPLADRSALPEGILADIRAMRDNASIVDMMALRTRITDDLREARRMPTGEKKIPYLSKLKTEVDNATDNMLTRAGEFELLDNLKQFRKSYLDDYVKPFEKGAAGRVLKFKLNDDYAVPDEKVAKEFFNSWGETASKQFNDTFKNSGNAQRAMEAAALDSLYDSAVKDGALNPSRILGWQKKHSGVLQDFPEINQKTQNIYDVVDEIAKRRVDLADRRNAIEQDMLTKNIRRIEGGAVTPESVIDRAIKNPQFMRRLYNGMTDDISRNALGAYVWDKALDSQDPVQFLRSNNQALKTALGDEKFRRAMTISKAMNKQKLVPLPEAGTQITKTDFLQENLGTGWNQLASRFFAAESGRTSWRYVLSEIASRLFNAMDSKMAREVLRESIYDPDMAKELVRSLDGQLLSMRGINRIYTFMLNNGIIAARGELEREEEARGNQPLELTITPADIPEGSR